MKGQPRRDWSAARAKVEAEGVCRVCRRPNPEAAHVTGRKHDKPKAGGKTLYVKPESVVALCGQHHRAYDAHELDLLPYLTLDEQLQAVADAGGLELARVRLCPSEYRSVRAGRVERGAA